MAYFKDAQEVYDALGHLLTTITADDDELAPGFRRADTVVRYEYSQPDSVITPAFPRYRQQLIDRGRADLVES